VHICHPSTQRLRQEDDKFEASLGYRAIPCLKKTTTKIPMNGINIEQNILCLSPWTMGQSDNGFGIQKWGWAVSVASAGRTELTLMQ
jgi:hypothetical protein